MGQNHKCCAINIIIDTVILKLNNALFMVIKAYAHKIQFCPTVQELSFQLLVLYLGPWDPNTDQSNTGNTG